MASNVLNRKDITAEVFENAQPGDAFKDSAGRLCEVTKNHGKVDGQHTLTITIPGYDWVDIILDKASGKIMDKEEWAVMLELNTSKVQFIPKDEA